MPASRAGSQGFFVVFLRLSWSTGLWHKLVIAIVMFKITLYIGKRFPCFSFYGSHWLYIIQNGTWGRLLSEGYALHVCLLAMGMHVCSCVCVCDDEKCASVSVLDILHHK